MKEFYPRSISDLRWYTENSDNLVIMPGSFNPLHDAHKAIIGHARAYTGRPVFLEHCVNSLDKPDSRGRIIDVVEQAWSAGCSVIITDANKFADKCELFSKPTFVLGADTFGRILDPKYHYGCKQGVRNDLQFMQLERAEFLVYPRIIDSKLITMSSFDTEEYDIRNFMDMSEKFVQDRLPFTPIEMSSTMLRGN
jgi:hypothetical protein